MQLKTIGMAVGIMAALATAGAQDVPANHLLLSEVVINSIAESATGSSEYVEIYNPTDAAISLDNYYITDYSQFYNFPIFQANNAPIDLGGGDYIMRFPAGSSIPSGGVVVVAWFSTSFATDFFAGNLANFNGLPGSPQLFECNDSNPAVPNMISYNANPDANSAVNFSKTNVGEFVMLAYWDGQTDLVKDVDLVSWGSTVASGGDTLPQRNLIESDGPDADGNLTAYAFDNGIDTRNNDVDPSFDPNMLVRRSTIELGEIGMTGNGHQGQDETMEWNWDTWFLSEGDGGSNTEGDQYISPGTTLLVKNSANPIPVIGAVSRSVQHPAPGTQFKITCAAGAVTAPVVKLTINTGSGFNTTMTMTLNATTKQYEATVGPYTEGTHLTYYFEATAGGQTGRLPLASGLRYEDFNLYYHLNILADPIDKTDILINEIMFDPAGGDNSTRCEYVELYNNRNVPLNLSGYTYSDFETNPERCVFPEGSIIPANGFLILAANEPLFETQYAAYPNFNPAQVIWTKDMLSGANPGHNNDQDTPTIADCNAYRWGNRPTVGFQTVHYTNGNQTTFPGTPWPVFTTNSGYSVELKNPSLDSEDGANWALSLAQHGSPLSVNQQSSVSDWTLY